MNVEFMHINNKAIIKDENGNTKMVPYYDNLKEVLIQENVIELMEEEMKKLLENYEYYKDKNFKYIPLFTVFLELFCYFGAPLIIKTLGAPQDWLNEVTKSGLTNTEIIRYIWSVIGLILGPYSDFILYSINDKENSRKNGTFSEKILLEKQMELERKILSELQNDKINSSIQTEKDFEMVKIDNDLIANNVKYLINFFYNLGYNEKKLFKSFIKDKLDKYYSDGLLERANDYFEEKGPMLAKKYNNNIKKYRKE